MYITGNAIAILDGPNLLLQTIYHDDAETLDAVAVDEETGKIAVATRSRVYVYQPFGEVAAALKWSQQCSIECAAAPDSPTTLSWGPSEEILLGSSALMLHQLTFGDTLIWSRPVSTPPLLALLSPDAGYIASIARHDRLVKIWRRLSFGSEDVQFDYSYLAHPSTVTNVQWRKRREEYHGADQVLYTTCSDGNVRVWTMTNHHTVPVFQLWAEINMQESIQPRQLHDETRSQLRFAFIMDGLEFFDSVQAAHHASNEDPFLGYLISEISQCKPDVCVVMDAAGHMCAWGMRNVGYYPRGFTDVFNVALVEDLVHPSTRQFLQDASYTRMLSFGNLNSSTVAILVQSFDGQVAWLQGDVAEVFNPSLSKIRLHSEALWTGHEGPIKKIVRTRRGRAVLSRTDANQAMVWKQASQREGGGLACCSTLNSPEHIHRSCILGGGNFVVNLHHESISLWDTRHSQASVLSSCAFQIRGKPLCALLLSSPQHEVARRFVATISSEMSGIVWQILIPERERQNGTENTSRPRIEEFCRFDIGSRQDLVFVLPIDPAGSAPVVTGFLDTFAKDIALSYTTDGTLNTWAAKIDLEKKTVQWLSTATVSTGVNHPSLASGTSIRKVAIVSSSRNGLTIWDTKSAELEYEKEYSAVDVIQDLDWTSTPDDQSILAVGFPHKIVILTQIRYDYLDHGAAWASIREISIRDFTSHPIGDSTWLGEGNLVIGSGNQLFLYDRVASIAEGMTSALSSSIHQNKPIDLFDIVSFLNGPLPVFHPQFLSQLVLAGKMPLAQSILVILNHKLKFYTEGDALESWLSMALGDFLAGSDGLPSQRRNSKTSSLDASSSFEVDSVTENVASELTESLAKKSLPFLTRHEQFSLVNLVECVATAEKQRRSMDANAVIFTLFFRSYALRQTRAQSESAGISWREITWAFHSGSQDILIDTVSRHYQGKMQWKHARECGLFMWIQDINVLREQLELVARNEYTKTYAKDPTDCSLYYVALRKKNLLLGLWRMAAWHREQASTQRLLANNFSEARWKTAALKNAYALLGRRRFAYAATFFLLAGQLRDAVNVCAQQLDDLQLAIAIARAHEGDGGPVLAELLEQRVLPRAAFEGNRWMATWAFWMLGRRDRAVRALITPVHALLDPSPSGPPSQQARSYLATDPALVALYRQLRARTPLTLMGATQVSPREEWEFVVRIARLYDRMGCDILALDLGMSCLLFS